MRERPVRTSLLAMRHFDLGIDSHLGDRLRLTDVRPRVHDVVEGAIGVEIDVRDSVADIVEEQ